MDKWVLDTMLAGYSLEFTCLPMHSNPTNQKSFQKATQHLLCIRAIESVVPKLATRAVSFQENEVEIGSFSDQLKII